MVARWQNHDHILTVGLLKLPALQGPAADTMLPLKLTFRVLSEESGMSSDVLHVLQTAATAKCLREPGPEKYAQICKIYRVKQHMHNM